jgi:hypothetical protein
VIDAPVNFSAMTAVNGCERESSLDHGQASAGAHVLDRHAAGPRHGAGPAKLSEALSSLPVSLGKLTAVDDCAGAFVTGIERRKRRIYCPGWVGAMYWLRPLFATRAYDLVGKKTRADLLARLDAEVAALGRSTSARTEALEKQPTG